MILQSCTLGVIKNPILLFLSLSNTGQFQKLFQLQTFRNLQQRAVTKDHTTCCDLYENHHHHRCFCRCLTLVASNSHIRRLVLLVADSHNAYIKMHLLFTQRYDRDLMLNLVQSKKHSESQFLPSSAFVHQLFIAIRITTTESWISRS